jgi:hypothetical protein
VFPTVIKQTGHRRLSILKQNVLVETVKMHFSTLPLLATIASFTATAVAAPKAKPPAFFLAGDSTTAVQSAGGGGTIPQPHTQHH